MYQRRERQKIETLEKRERRKDAERMGEVYIERDR